MERVILAVGMRGAGKTTYCKRVKAQHPNIHLISRDEFFIQNFGDCSFDPYTGTMNWAYELFWQHINDVVSQYKGTLLIDSWTGWSSDRANYIKRLRKMGVAQVDCWYFDAELETCIKGFVQRELNPDRLWENEESLARRTRHDYKLFHTNLSNIFPRSVEPKDVEQKVYRHDPEKVKDTFDGITIIIVEQLIMPGMPLI